MKYLYSTSSTASDLNKKFKEYKRSESELQIVSKITITVLGNVSTQYLVSSIYSSLIFNKIIPDIYESSFDQWEFELNNPESESYKRNSDYTLLLLSTTRLILNSHKNAYEFAANIKDLLIKYKKKCPGQILFILPESIREGFDQTSFFYNWVKDLRKELQIVLENIVNFIDIDPLIMEFGFEKWHPSKYLTSAKFCCHPNCFPLYGNYIANSIQSLIRKSTRLVITDLDNTLWNGVVGEVGWEGVGLDHDSNGYPHLMLQHYLLSLKETGTLLAICSKNSFETAKMVFDNRSEMILKFDDFVAHEISWDPKSESIKKILRDLNLTETGVTFLDDSKFEREDVKNNLPEIAVPELPENTESWCEFLSKTGLFTIGKIKDEDLKRSSMYFAEKKRKEDSLRSTNYSSFLAGLNLILIPERISESNFDRVLELIHKTNQFNLTTIRIPANELERLISNNDYFSYCYRLKDKYSDYGIIAVFIAKKIFPNWEINTWLMSCRAMGRGVEYAIFEHFLNLELAEGESVFGDYLATEKNKPIAQLLEKIGFTRNSKNGKSSFTGGQNSNQKANYISIMTSI
jgi:FkbH-like protein